MFLAALRRKTGRYCPFNLQAVKPPANRGIKTGVKRLKPPAMASHIPSPAVTARDTFRYTNFGDGKSIRILTLQPGVHGDTLCGQLTTENLADAPSYEAISYVWGNGDRNSELVIQNDHGVGDILPVTQSIHDALTRMRLADRPRRLWADQICINQDDISERGQQVSLMNGIFQSASRVLVWLGHDDEGMARRAKEKIQLLRNIFSDDKARKEYRRVHSEELPSQDRGLWTPLSKLTNNPWFRRIWIVQEIGTSTPATLFWGDAEIDWDTLSYVAGILNTDFHLLRTRFKVFTPNIRYLYRRFVEPEVDWDETHNRGSFVYELHRARHLRTKDPRDHVFAFLGHFSVSIGGEDLKSMIPDYGLPISEVYTDTAIRALNGAKNLILLSAVHSSLSKERQSKFRKPSWSLPSWVPDWQVMPMHLIGSPQTPHRAAGDTTPRLEIDEQSRVLHIVGKRIDVIRRNWWSFYSHAFTLRHDANRTPPFERLWRDLCGYQKYSLATKYVNSEDPSFFAMVQTLTNACIGVDRSREYEEIPKDEWLAHGAAYVMRSKDFSPTGPGSLEDEISQELRDIACNGDAFKWSHEASLVTRYRRFGLTQKGYFLLGPEMLDKGDVVVLLYGGRTPFILRPRRDGDGWHLLGECYAHGLMNGEGMNQGEDEVFSIH